MPATTNSLIQLFVLPVYCFISCHLISRRHYVFCIQVLYVFNQVLPANTNSLIQLFMLICASCVLFYFLTFNFPPSFMYFVFRFSMYSTRCCHISCLMPANTNSLIQLFVLICASCVLFYFLPFNFPHHLCILYSGLVCMYVGG